MSKLPRALGQTRHATTNLLKLRIPKGFRLKAQGCEERATLGMRHRTSTTLKRLRQYQLQLWVWGAVDPQKPHAPHVLPIPPSVNQSRNNSLCQSSIQNPVFRSSVAPLF